MIMRNIDRSRSTGGGMALSFALHGGLLLLLGLMAGHQASLIKEGGELTEIAYIEATYGEDVAAKVKLKQKPIQKPRPEPPGQGVNTDSAFKPKAEARPEPPRPKAMDEMAPEIVGTLASAPKLQQAKPKTMKVVAKPQSTTMKPKAAKIEVATPLVQSSAKPAVLAQASQLETKTPRPKARKVIDAGKLGQPVKTLQTADASSPQTSTKSQTGAFKPQAGGLKNRTGTLAAGDDVLAVADNPRPRRPAGSVAEAGASAAVGGSLKSSGRGTYSAPKSGLAPAAGSSGSVGKSGVMDVSGPSGDSGGAKSGRKTILNYGSGSGGRGGSLNSRQRIAEPQVADVVEKSQTDSQPRKAVAEVKLDAKNVNMSITGQIQGRKILQSSPALYSPQAKKNGWEGVVAVHFTVLADGRVKDNVYFEQTSVHRDLNQAAMAAIKKFRFAPLGANKAAVEQWGVITIVFKLN
jgi:TonB family protein